MDRLRRFQTDFPPMISDVTSLAKGAFRGLLGAAWIIAWSCLSVCSTEQRIAAPLQELASQQADVELEQLRSDADKELRQRHDDKAEALYKQLLAKAIRFGDTNGAISDALLDLGRFYMRQGNKSAAEPYYRRCLSLRQCAVGFESQFLDPILGALTQITLDKGEQSQAYSLLTRLFTIRELALPQTDPLYSVTLKQLVSLSIKLARWNDAELYLKRMIAAQLSAAHDLSALQTLLDLVEIYEKQHKFDKAAKCWNLLLQTGDDINAGASERHRIARAGLIGMYLQQNKTVELMKLLTPPQTASDIGSAASSGQDIHASTKYAQALLDLAAGFQRQQRLDRTEACWNLILQSRKCVENPMDSQSCSARAGLAQLYQQQNRADELVKLLGPTPTTASENGAPSMASAQNVQQHAELLEQQAEALISKGKTAQALPLLEQELRIHSTAGTEDTVSHAVALHYLSFCLAGASRYQEAEKASTHALAIRRKLKMFDSGLTNNLEVLGNIYDNLKQHDKCEQAWRQAVLAEKSYPRSKIDLACDIYYLAGALNVEKKYDEAYSQYKQAVQIAATVPKEQSRKVLFLNALITSCIDQGKRKEALAWLKKLQRLTPHDTAVAAKMKQLEAQAR